jgi:hypothetical protein
MGLVLAGNSCARYEYDLVRLPEQSVHIGPDTDIVVSLDPLQYRLRAVENRLVVQIFNPTSDAIEIVGPRSTLVDPAGQSHPLPSQTIAPLSYAKLILPPFRPQSDHIGPAITIGVGAVYGRCDAPGPGACDDTHAGNVPNHVDQPLYLTDAGTADVPYFDWDGETNVRLTIVYQGGDRQFSHELTFHRKKM